MNKIVSWNVGGLSSCVSDSFQDGISFEDYIGKSNADIYCFQEVRKKENELKNIIIDNYNVFYNPSINSRYGGTAIYYRAEPKDMFKEVELKDIMDKEIEKDGRINVIESNDFYLVNLYLPNVGGNNQNLEYKKKWLRYLEILARRLDEKKPVILCGDFNVGTDYKAERIKSHNGRAGFNKEEQKAFREFLATGRYTDAFTHKYPTEEVAVKYLESTKPENSDVENSHRLDYIFVSNRIATQIDSFNIALNMKRGKNHYPLELTINI